MKIKFKYIFLALILLLGIYYFGFPEDFQNTLIAIKFPEYQEAASESTKKQNLDAYISNLQEISYDTLSYMAMGGTLKNVYYDEGYDTVIAKTVDNEEYYSTVDLSCHNVNADMEANSVIVKPFNDVLKDTTLKGKIKSIVVLPFRFIADHIPLTLGIALFFWLLMLPKREADKETPPKSTVGVESGTAARSEPPTPRVMNVNGNRTNTTVNIQPEITKTFKDVAGLHEVKKDMQSLVDFLKNKDAYIAAGAKLPKGVIFYGPPGTGKTLLAKAIAGEAGVPFFFTSGSDFVEMYVGVGPKRIRELFARAKNNAPCIVFIDEIDAIGSQRTGGENSEDRKTINALLTEMDGFTSADNVLVIAATNRIEDLDPALTRPGRFTNKFCIPLPQTAKERLEVIKLYSANKKFSEDVDFDALAKETFGYSPATIEALLNEAAIVSVQDKKKLIDKESIEKANFKLLLSGHVREDQTERDENELKLVAWHEAGHALVGLLCGKEVPKVTILASTSGAGGVTFTTPKKTGLYSVEDLKDEVKQLYGGRVAEYILLRDKNKVTTGASSDIQKATRIIEEIVTNYGMSEHFGLLNLEGLKVDRSVILEKEVEIAKELEAETEKLLSDHYDSLQRIADSLLEKETLYYKELLEIL